MRVIRQSRNCRKHGQMVPEAYIVSTAVGDMQHIHVLDLVLS